MEGLLLPESFTRLLQNLVTRGFLTQVDHKRWAYYLLSDAQSAAGYTPTTEVTEAIDV